MLMRLPSPSPLLRAKAKERVLDRRTCPGDGSCTECDTIAVDTSHLTFLARVARRLERADLSCEVLLFRLVQVTACWSPDRLVTAEAVYEREVNPHGDASKVLDELGVGLVSDDQDWSKLIGRAVGQRAAELTAVATRFHGGQEQEMDCTLLGHSLAEADQRPVHLVSNDEALLVSARQAVEHLRVTDRSPPSGFLAINSVELMRRMLGCGAINIEVMEGALLAEWDDVSQRHLGANKRKKKLDRLTTVARSLNVRLPDPDRPFDDSDLFAEFLGKVDEYGP